MPAVVPLVAAAATVGGAVISSKAAGKAAKVQAASTDQATAEQRRQYDQTRNDFAPWREAGGAAIGRLSDMMLPGYDYKTSPGYQFRFGEGMRAVESSAASKGALMSGGTYKALQERGDGLAADDFDRSFNRNASIAAGGQQVNTTLGNLGANMATNIGNNMMQGANARASGYAGQAAAWGGALNNLAQIGMRYGG